MNRLAEHSVVTPSGGSRPYRWLVAIAVAACAGTGLAGRSAAQEVKTDYERKAMILYNFARYTEWPKSAFASDKAPFVLGILGKDPFGKDVGIIKDKTVRGRRIEVRYFTTVEEFKECHLLFIAKSEMQNLARILKRLENLNTLTTAEEAQGFIEQDGIINLVRNRKPNGTETVEFEVNLLAAEKANLKLDNQLLKLAKKVKTYHSPKATP